MKSPFPGMDPYLEQMWLDVHHTLCTYAREQLQPQIRPALIARIDQRLVVETEQYESRSLKPNVWRREKALLKRTPYRACIKRSWKPLEIEFYHLPLKERLLKIPIPLREHDSDAYLDLQELIDRSYLYGAFDTMNYSQPLNPPLDPRTAEWANELIAKRNTW